MSNKFKELKVKYLLRALVKSVICGLSAGLIVVGALLLALKLSAITLDVVWYVVIGVGAALVTGVITFIFFMPTDKKVARILDNEFGLEERVQTSLAYSKEKGVIIQMQRDDAADKLNTLPKEKFKFSKIWQFCVIAIVAIAIAVTAFFVPAKQVVDAGNQGGEDDPVVTVTLFHVTSVKTMINNVTSAEGFDEEVKTATVAELQILLDKLNASYYDGVKISKSGLTNAVLLTINNVERVIYGSLKYTAFPGIIKGETPTLSSTALANAVEYGLNSYSSLDIYEYGHVDSFYAGNMYINQTSTKINAGLNALRQALEVKLEDGLADAFTTIVGDTMNAVGQKGDYGLEANADCPAYYCLSTLFSTKLVTLNRANGVIKTADAAVAPIKQEADRVNAVVEGLKKEIDEANEALDALNKALEEATAAGDEDEIANLTSQIEAKTGEIAQLTEQSYSKNDELSELNKKMEEQNSAVQKQISEVFTDFNNELSKALASESYYGAMRRYIRNNLVLVFESFLSVDEYYEYPTKDVGIGGGSTEGGDKKPGDGTEGGGGGGNDKVGSDDLIYNPRTGQYVSYGELLDEYKAILEELKQSGEFDQALQDMADIYFDLLSGSIKSDDLNN